MTNYITLIQTEGVRIREKYDYLVESSGGFEDVS